MNRAAFLLMALAIAAGAFAPVSPLCAPYLKALVVAATGIAGLCLHPPGRPPPDKNPQNPL